MVLTLFLDSVHADDESVHDEWCQPALLPEVILPGHRFEVAQRLVGVRSVLRQFVSIEKGVAERERDHEDVRVAGVVGVRKDVFRDLRPVGRSVRVDHDVHDLPFGFLEFFLLSVEIRDFCGSRGAEVCKQESGGDRGCLEKRAE